MLIDVCGYIDTTVDMLINVCGYIDTTVAFYCDILFVQIDEVFCKINVTIRNEVYVFY